MKNCFHRIWDKMSDPDLRLPLAVVVLFLVLVLAGLALSSGQAGSAAVQAEMGLVTGDGVQVPPPEERDAPSAPAAETPEPEEHFAQIQILETETAPRSGWISQDGKEYYLDAEGEYAVGLRRIDGQLVYFDENGVRASSLGMDVSYYDNSIDWERVKEAGIDFAIVRVGGRGWTSGMLYGDYRTQQYLRRARAAGLKLGVYFYSTAVDPAEAVEEAEAALRAVDGIPLELPIFIDMEFSGEYPRGRADRLSPSERTEIAVAFCETVRSAGYRAGVYASQNYLKASIDYNVISRYTVWLASYTRDNALPFFDRRYDIWQFTDRGRVDGVAGDADLNVIF